jgi:hypothetical protein
MKKIVFLVFTILCMFSSNIVFANTQTTSAFSDVKGHWAENSILDMAKQGVVTGFPDGTFRPNDPIQVDQFLAMILRVLSEEKPNGTRGWKNEFVSRTDLYTRHTLENGSPGFDFTQAKEGYWAKLFIDQATNMNIVMKYDRWGGKLINL